MNLNKINFFYYLLVIILPLLAITFSANYNFIDSSNYFFKTLFSGDFFNMYSKNWPYYNPVTHENRFQPFVGIFQNLILFFDSIKSEKSIYWVQFIIFSIALFFAILSTNKNHLSVYLVYLIFLYCLLFNKISIASIVHEIDKLKILE